MSETIYTQQVTLPSLGLPYGDQLPGGIVSVDPFGVEEEELLQKAGSKARREIISTLIANCVKNCPVAPDQFLTGDRLYLFMQIRRITLGEGWTFDWACRRCDTRNTTTIPISQFRILGPKSDPETGELPEWEEVRYVTLPHGNYKVGWRHLRGYDEQAAIENAAELKKKGIPYKGDPAYRHRIKASLVTVNGEELEPVEADAFVKKALSHGGNGYALRQSMEEHAVGIDLDLERECDECGWENKIDFQFDMDEFFRPRRP